MWGSASALGIGAGAFHDAPTIRIFAVLGIVSLFLFAGMEVDLEELNRGRAVLAQHLVIRALVIAGATWLIQRFLHFDTRPAVLVALALLTPSTGFILSSLASLDLSPDERFWIKSKAIATEIVALAALFIALQSTSPETLGLSTVALLLMILLLPVIFKMFARAILPYAPNTEFAFLVIVALLCASLTKKLGVYYLVGAFVVGVTEQRLRTELPALATDGLMRAVELFASFFIPFYFLEAGLTLTPENFSLAAFELAGIFAVCALPASAGDRGAAPADRSQGAHARRLQGGRVAAADARLLDGARRDPAGTLRGVAGVGRCDHHLRAGQHAAPRLLPSRARAGLRFAGGAEADGRDEHSRPRDRQLGTATAGNRLPGTGDA